MGINRIIEEANEVADKYNLKLIEIDRTDNIINLQLFIDNGLFIQIYIMEISKRTNLILRLFLNRDVDMGTTLKAVNTAATLLTNLTDIYLLIIRKQYMTL